MVEVTDADEFSVIELRLFNEADGGLFLLAVIDGEPFRVYGPFDTKERRHAFSEEAAAVLRKCGGEDLPLEVQ